jgi:hypothetical protein
MGGIFLFAIMIKSTVAHPMFHTYGIGDKKAGA